MLAADAQSLDTVSVSLTLRSQDWAWAVGKLGAGNDSTERVKIRSMRDAIRTANPATWQTNVTLSNIPGRIVMWIYNSFVTAPFDEMMAMGNTNAERITIYTNIRAINNSAVQLYIGIIDTALANQFIESRKRGKEILLDN